MKKQFFLVMAIVLASVGSIMAQCNVNASICTPGTAGPFTFSTKGPQVSNCLEWRGNKVAYIILNIATSGNLNLLIKTDKTTNYLDVALFRIPAGADPCTAIQNVSNQIGCNFAPSAVGCNQFGSAFSCGASVAAPAVVAGDRILIVAEDYDNAFTNFTLQVGAGGATVGPPNGTVTAVSGTKTTASPDFQITAANMGGTWSASCGSCITSAGVFKPSVAGVGSHTVNYTVGISPCNGTGSTTVVINPVANVAPVINAQSFSIAENSANNTVVGTVVATDVDALTYSITAGNTNGAFSINSSNGQLRVANSSMLDYETTTSFALTVQVSDGSLSSSATVTVNVTNVIEAPFLTATGSVDFHGSSPAVVVAPGLTLTAESGVTFSEASVAIAAGFVATDRLEYTTIHGISGTYNTTTGILKLTGTATAAQYQAALRSVTYRNTVGVISSSTTRSVNFTIGGSLYNEENGHFYELIDNGSAINWTTAKNNAASRNYFGLQGYLVTITSASENLFVSQKINSNSWMGASDAHTEGTWRWVAGPEGLENGGLGRHFSNQNKTGSCSAIQAPGINGYFAAWASAEPNDCGGDEDVAHFIGSSGTWNDFPHAGGVSLYVVEYGGMPGDPTIQVIDNVTVNVLPNLNAAPSIANAYLTTQEDEEMSVLLALYNNYPQYIIDADGDTMQAIIFISLPSNGTLIDGNGQPVVINQEYGRENIRYIPNAQYSGVDTFGFNISDGQLYAAAPALAIVTIQNVNDLPELQDIVSVTDEDNAFNPFSGFVASSFYDEEGEQPAVFKIVSLPVNGTLTFNGDPVTAGDDIAYAQMGGLLYTPAQDYFGSDSFLWNASDGANFAAANASVLITINSVNDAPTAIALSTDSVNENSAPGTIIGTLTSTDVELADTHTYLMVNGAGDAGNVYVEVVGDQLVVTNNINYEFTSQITVRVMSLDSGGDSYEEVITIRINDVNDAPASLTLSNNVMDEQQQPGNFVGILSTYDEDANDSHTITFVSGAGDADNASFDVVNNVLVNNAVLDFNSQSQYSIRLRSTDAAGAFIEEEFVINLNDINQAPTAIALSHASIDENNAIGALVGFFSSTDVDTHDTHTYTLVAGQGDDDNASFATNGIDLVAAEIFDFEAKSSYSIRVRSTDAGGLFTEEVFTISILDAPDAPTGITLSATSVDENQPTGTFIGEFSTLDPDQTGGHTYSLVAGIGSDDNGVFQVGSNKISTAMPLNYEVKSSYTIRVRSVDNSGGYTEEVFTITVNDLNDAPTDLTVNIIGIDENTAIGTTAGFISVSDEDVANVHTFTLTPGFGANDNGKFSILDNKLQVNAALDYEVQHQFTVRLRATDNAGAYTEKDFAFTIGDVNEVPTAIALTATSISENEPAGAIIGIFGTTDQDNADSHTYDFATGTGDDDNAAFHISGNMLVANVSFNFEAQSSYSIRVSSTDLGGLVHEEVFTINIINEIDAPIVSDLTKVIFKNVPQPFSTREFTHAFSQDEGRSLKQIRILTLPSHGQLMFLNTPIVAGQTILLGELTSMSFVPAYNYVGADGFTFASYDGVTYSADATYSLNIVPFRQIGGAGTSINDGSIVVLNRAGTGLIHKEGEVGVEQIPFEVSAFGNYPNPFNGVTNITFELPTSMKVTLEVYDMQGRKVKTLVDGEELTGKQTILWNGNEAGQYICRIVALGANGEEIIQTIGMVQVK